MTFTEIDEFVWSGDFEASEARIASLPPVDRTAYRIIQMMLGRKGFEYWWVPEAVGGMDAECNDEIFDEMRRIIAAHSSETNA